MNAFILTATPYEIDNSIFILILEIRQLRPVELWNMPKLIYLVYAKAEEIKQT